MPCENITEVYCLAKMIQQPKVSQRSGEQMCLLGQENEWVATAEVMPLVPVVVSGSVQNTRCISNISSRCSSASCKLMECRDSEEREMIFWNIYQFQECFCVMHN